MSMVWVDPSLIQWVLLATLLVANYPIVAYVEHRVNQPGIRRVYDIPVPPEQLRREKRTALTTTPVHALVFAGFLVSGIWQPTEGVLPVIWSFVLALVWTEIWNYLTHVAFHTRYLFFIHRTHHLSSVTNPWSSTSFSFLEKLIFSAGIVGGMAALSRLIPISFAGVAVYYVFYFYITALGHANYESREPGYADTWLGKVLNTPSFHALHHARFDKNYGLMSPLLDRWFGTEWSDATAVQSQAAKGEPLTRLKEQLSASR